MKNTFGLELLLLIMILFVRPLDSLLHVHQLSVCNNFVHAMIFVHCYAFLARYVEGFVYDRCNTIIFYFR